MAAIDLNADLGRSGVDEAILDVVTSVNVPCGFHAGDPSTLRRACRAAADRGVAIGAQVSGARVSFPDTAGSGPRGIDIGPSALRDAVLYQLGALDGFAQVAGAGITYVKPDGALFDACVVRPEHAEAVAEAAHEFDPSMAVLGVPGSTLLAVADALGMEAIAEAVADRGYRGDGKLVPLTEPGAVLTDPGLVAHRASMIATERCVTAVDGSVIDLHVRSIGIHGDAPVALARAVRAALESASIGIHPFAL
jgi:UPF0271 protein